VTLAQTLFFLGLYSLILFGIGIVANRRSLGETQEDYFVASRTFGLFVLFFTYEATLFSMWFFLGTGGFWYTHGVGFYCHVLWMTMSGVILYWVGTRLWLVGKRWGFVTPADLLAHRYNSEAIRVVTAVVGIGFVFPYLLLQIVGAGRLLGAAAGLEMWQGAGLMMLVVVTYTLLGGGRAVAWTDAFQGCLFFSVIWFIAIWALTCVGGGWTAMWDRLVADSPQHLTLPGPKGEFTPLWWFSFWFVQGTAMAMPGVWMRVYSARNATVLRQTAALVPLAGAIGYLATLLYAFSATPHFPGLVGPEADKLLPLMLNRFHPEWTIPLVVAAFAAGMSTADSQLLAGSAMITGDLYKRYVVRGASERHLVWVGRGFVVFFTLLTWFVGSFFDLPLIVRLGIMAYAGTSNLMVPLIGALFWPRATARGALSGLLTGVLLFLLLDPKTSPFFSTNPLPVDPGFVGLVCNAVVFVAVSLCTRHRSGERHEEYRSYLKQAYEQS